ncbi:MAG: hypothetical protein JWM98_728, partial [Thermoleophilia bacterium]|nr:hypothetical protein [Thermoleophilia bacterium]
MTPTITPGVGALPQAAPAPTSFTRDDVAADMATLGNKGLFDTPNAAAIPAGVLGGGLAVTPQTVAYAAPAATAPAPQA